ncbi:MAG: zinc ribbon domain-containing protein [Methanomicrobiales archaeon]|jgi:hypothetical protein|nr:zinc ribbon domain-containing protein [Methanomicrobiales archaeon]
MEFDPNQKFCQSCAMPMSDSDYGTEKDESLSSEYCMYCYQNGAFVDESITMAEMSEFCAQQMAEMDIVPYEEGKEMMDQMLPHLKRWKAD